MRFALLALLAACTPVGGVGQGTPQWVAAAETPSPTGRPSIADRYRATATAIIEHATKDRGAFAKLAYLTDHIGHRLAGEPSLDQAIAWATEAMKADGHDAKTEAAMVPKWVRGRESAELVTPVARPLKILGLGGSVGTPAAGITAPVVVVRDWAELDAKRESVKGAIVVFDHAMAAWNPKTGSGYGEAVEYRGQAASRASKYGAVAVLVRSVTAHSLATPHTGAMRYDDAVPKIPAASLTVEDTMLLARLAARGPVSVKLAMEAQTFADVPSANVIGELRGKELPDEVVIIGAHLDSWDVGTGAHDDGAGCVTMMQALTTLRALKLAPRRTIRVVLFTNEENGLRGAKQYAKDHAAEFANMVLAVEADSGGYAPVGFSLADPAPVARVAKLRDIASLLAPIGASRVLTGHGGADIGQLTGVPQIGLITDGRTYFDIHHTEADTLDKVDPAALAKDVAAVAVLAYIVADMPDRL